jgi:hypothetical protein
MDTLAIVGHGLTPVGAYLICLYKEAAFATITLHMIVVPIIG